MVDLLPGLDHIANFINALDTEGMTANDVRSAIYAECIKPSALSKQPDEAAVAKAIFFAGFHSDDQANGTAEGLWHEWQGEHDVRMAFKQARAALSAIQADTMGEG